MHCLKLALRPHIPRRVEAGTWWHWGLLHVHVHIYVHAHSIVHPSRHPVVHPIRHCLAHSGVHSVAPLRAHPHGSIHSHSIPHVETVVLVLAWRGGYGLCSAGFFVDHKTLHVGWIDAEIPVLLAKVAHPVVFARKRFPALDRVRASRFGTVEFPRLFMLVIDVTIQVCLRTKLLVAAVYRAFVLPLVVSLMMTKNKCQVRRETKLVLMIHTLGDVFAQRFSRTRHNGTL